jgi:hypothetical protein
MTDSGREGPLEQHNHSSGTFIGGNNYAPIRNELLDPRTKATLAKLSEDAPELANILKKALRDGIISSDVVAALQSAVRNINEDVANALLIAGRNINEDVADALLTAGTNINADVAMQFVRVNEDLTNTARELDRKLDSLRETVGQLSSQKGSDPDYHFRSASTDTGTPLGKARVITRPPARSIGKWWFRVRMICSAFGVGVVAGALLMHYHLGAYVWLAGVLGFIALVIPWIASPRREARVDL